MRTALQPIQKIPIQKVQLQHFVVVDTQSGRTIADFVGDRIFFGNALARIVGICLLQDIGVEDLQFMTELPTSETTSARDEIQKLIKDVQCHMPIKKLTRREMEVLRGIVQCRSNKEIGHDINLSERTVKFHVSSLLQKYRVRGRAELARKAVHEVNDV